MFYYFPCVSKLGPRVVTTVADTWEAAPAQALVKTMEIAATTITVSAKTHKSEQDLQPSLSEGGLFIYRHVGIQCFV